MIGKIYANVKLKKINRQRLILIIYMLIHVTLSQDYLSGPGFLNSNEKERKNGNGKQHSFFCL